MVLNTASFNGMLGHEVRTITLKGGIYGCATIHAIDGAGRSFSKLVGMMNSRGKWVWVHSDFRK